MVLLDPISAISRALATTSWPVAGRCLQAVDSYYGNPGSRMGDLGPLPGGAPNGNWQDAQQGYWGSAHKHPGDATDAPAGVPIYYTQMIGGDKAGHIVLSLGGGLCRTTGGTRVYTQSIASLNAERPSPNGGSSVLGWTEDYGNNPIAGISATAALNVTPFAPDIPAPEVRKPDMIFIALEDSQGRFGGGTFYALFGGNKWVQIPDVTSANAIATQFPGQAAARVSYETWGALQAASA